MEDSVPRRALPECCLRKSSFLEFPLLFIDARACLRLINGYETGASGPRQGILFFCFLAQLRADRILFAVDLRNIGGIARFGFLVYYY